MCCRSLCYLLKIENVTVALLFPFRHCHLQICTVAFSLVRAED